MAIRSLVYTLLLLTVVNATQVMHRPDNYKTLLKPHTHPSVANASVITPPARERALVGSALDKRAGSKVSIGYFTNWGIYGRNFQPSDINTATLTHILYSFADVDVSTGQIKLTDSYADEQKHYATDSWSDTGNNLYGCLKQMYLLKMKQRNLKVLLSIGGWTYSQSGHFNFVTDSTARTTFVNSAVQLIEDYGFDGIDIDFEYPANSAQGQGLASLLGQLRTAFDQLATKKGDKTPYQITAAVSAGAENNVNLVVPDMNKALTYWNLMAYDYAGSWSNVSDDQANLYGGVISNVSTDKAFKSYTSRGATASKISMGIPLYGRGFTNTAGIRQPFSGVGTGTWEAGVYDYKDLPLAGAKVVEDMTNVASYSYDPTLKELISYDTPNIVKTKTQYINTNGMAGSMFWSLDSDKTGGDSLITTSVALLGGLDQTQNHLNYPNSKWDNIRNNMGTTGGGSTPTSTVSSPPSSTPTAGGSCGAAAAWSAASVYTGGQTVSYNGHLWTAKWWTQGDTPGGPAGAWTDNGACTTKRSSRFFKNAV